MVIPACWYGDDEGDRKLLNFAAYDGDRANRRMAKIVRKHYPKVPTRAK